MVKIIDLNFLGFDRAIASYLLETSQGPVIIETGPHSTIENLVSGLNKQGYKKEDVSHVFLTHIHLDHAGAAWDFAQHGAKIYIHPFGEKHLADPSKLMNSAKQIYQDQMDALWGRMEEIDPMQLHVLEDGEKIVIGDLEIEACFTPGHAKHHIAWLVDGIAFTGDVAGVKVDNGPVVPPCPPPDINLEDWRNSISRLKTLKLKSLYLTHFGEITDVNSHFDELEEMLVDWSQWVYSRWKEGQSTEEMTQKFSDYTRQQLINKGVDERGAARYEAANPSWMSVAGLVRYWTKKEES